MREISPQDLDQRMMSGFQPYNTLMVRAFHTIKFYHFETVLALKVLMFYTGSSDKSHVLVHTTEQLSFEFTTTTHHWDI